MHFQWLLFDLDDTLMEFKGPATEALHATFEKFDIVINEETKTMYHKINGQVWRDCEEGKVTIHDLSELRMKLFLEQSGHKGILARDFNDHYLTSLAEGSTFYDETENVLTTLKERGFKMAIITNGLQRVQRYRWKNTFLPNYFEDIFIAEEIGRTKPHKYYFDYVHGSLKRPNREQVLVIGDNPVSDVKGANNYGYKSCWVNRDDTINNPPKADYQIKSLNDLIPILDGEQQ
jgi:YjjG family noncanonical pyrimidine nucleotidase